jgi:hypothetical protein
VYGKGADNPTSDTGRAKLQKIGKADYHKATTYHRLMNARSRKGIHKDIWDNLDEDIRKDLSRAVTRYSYAK